MLFEKDGKRDSDTEWRIYYLEWHLAVFLTTVTDPSLSLQDDALPWVLLYRQARKWLESRLCRLFNIILNGRKNALWERQKTGQWHRVKNLLPWMTSYGFPHHDNRSFAIASDDALPSPSLRQQILHIRFRWRLNVLYKDHGAGRQKELPAHAVRLMIPACRNDLIVKE